MPQPSFLWRLLTCLALFTTACAPGPGEWAPAPDEGPAGISTEAWRHGLAAHNRASLEGRTRSPLLAIIDFSLPSNARRLWVVDIGTGDVLANEYVAHGIRSGGLFAASFSNRDGSNQSSVGAFITANSYWGVRGLSLRLRGLEPGINDRAMARGIVLHGTPSVSAARAMQGSIGRTEGCPAVSMEAARRLVPLLEDGVVVFAWYPDPVLMARSEYLDPFMAEAARQGIRITSTPGGAGR
jgi:hypothetical protein